MVKKQIFRKPAVKQASDLYDIVLDGSALTWERLLYDIVEKEEMDLWDIDLNLLTQKYIEAISSLKQLDYRLSGKVLLAAAILLKIKSREINFEKLFDWKQRERKEKTVDDIEIINPEDFELIQAVPLPRRRKVTLKELITSLKKAIDESKSRQARTKYKEELIFEVEKLKRSEFNIAEKIMEVLERVKVFVQKFKRKKVEFKELIPSISRSDIVWTFLPLLHLSNSGEVILEQEEIFKDLWVVLPDESIARSAAVRKK